MSRACGEQQQILRFWWMLELFSPQQVPKLTSRATHPVDSQVIEWDPADPLPWETLPPPEPRNGTRRVWQHAVYLGVYFLEATYEWLHRAFGEDADAYDERPGGQSACAGLLIDDQGRLVPDSAVLSSALWAAGRIDDPGPQSPVWADGFTEAAKGLTTALDEFEGQRREDAGAELPPAHDAGSLLDILRIAQSASGTDHVRDLATSRIIIRSTAVSANRAGEAADTDFLNSFFLDDLACVRDDLAKGQAGAALATYLTSDQSLDTRSRTDVVDQPGAVDAGVVIERLPKGRWLSDPGHGLALSQQFAVNQALNDVGPTRGLMGVNGPPGTGKTTMLRDILAGNIVERARLLADLQRPEDAFTSTTHRWTAHDGHRRCVRQLRPELTGFEMVVASANNAAVENVTTEIPARSAIDGRWDDEADYFADIATAVLNETRRDEGEKAPGNLAWGLVAARLGNKRNRNDFYSAFWFDKKDPRTKEPVAGCAPRMQTRLAQWRDGEAECRSWREARKEFTRAEGRVDTLINARRKTQRRLQDLPRAARHERDLVARTEQLVAARRAAEVDLSEHETVRVQYVALLAEAEARYDRHLSAKPGILEILFSLGRAIRDWRAGLKPLAEDLRTVQHRQQEATARATQAQAHVSQLCADLAAAESDVARAVQTLASLRVRCAEDRERYGPGYPDDRWVGDLRELHAPWLDAELDAARSELFLAALRLHQDFFANAAGDMVNGLRAATEVVAGNYPHRLEPEKLRAAWQLFFLVVPMVSTTFASVGRMFGDVGQEAIGWLLIDEAGQASPQYAVGAIWRAQRVVVVGDPLQLQPVVTIPQKAQLDIASAFGLSATWMPPQSSVQTLADRSSLVGTTLRQGEQDVWVSAPLKVHRRCDNPMFNLCNQIAYNDMMVNGVHRRLDDPDNADLFDAASGPLIAPSHWVDEPARTRGSHLQENQIDRLQKALMYLQGKGIDASQVIAISPFRAVADRLATLSYTYRGLRGGTIHTAQGREAPVVVLVLGGDPDKPGAKSWAASTVNLVNVAASRAKRRLYVIGDRASWARHNYFHELAVALAPLQPPPDRNLDGPSAPRS